MRYTIKFFPKKSTVFGKGMSDKFHSAVWDGGPSKQWHDIHIVSTEMYFRPKDTLYYRTHIEAYVSIDIGAETEAELSAKTEICQSLVEYVWQATKNAFARIEIYETNSNVRVYKADL